MLVLAALAALVVAGCATAPKIDWTARMGHYTYNQAVAEFGRPDKTNQFAGGVTTADWLIERGHVQPAPQSQFLAPGGYRGPLMPAYNQPYVPDYYMRLTFGADGLLEDYKEFAR